MKTCARKYFTDQHTVKNLVSSVFFKYNAADDTLRAFFPRPWQFSAFAAVSNLSGSPTNYKSSQISLDTSNSESDYQLLFNIFIAFGLANAMEEGTDDGNTRYEPGTFSEYMAQYLTGTKPSNYNAWILPQNAYYDFWQSASTYPDFTTLRQEWNFLNENIANVSYDQLYNPPGVYTIFNATGAGGANTAPYATDLIAFLEGTDNILNVMTNELNCPVLTDEIVDTSPSYLPLGAFLDVTFTKYFGFLQNAVIPTLDFDDLTFPKYGVRAWFMVRTGLAPKDYQLLWRDSTGVTPDLVWDTFTMVDDVAQGSHFAFATADYTVFDELVLQVSPDGGTTWQDVLVKEVDFSSEFSAIVNDGSTATSGNGNITAKGFLIAPLTMGIYTDLEFDTDGTPNSVIIQYILADGTGVSRQISGRFVLSGTNNETTDTQTALGGVGVITGREISEMFDLLVQDSDLGISPQSRQTVLANSFVIPLCTATA